MKSTALIAIAAAAVAAAATPSVAFAAGTETVGVTAPHVAKARIASARDVSRSGVATQVIHRGGKVASAAAVKGAALGARSVLTLRAQFRDENGGVLYNEQTEPFDAQDVRERLITHPGSASNIFAAQSGGAQSLRSLHDPAGDVSGWIRMNTRARGCDSDAIERDSALAAAAASLGARAYDHLLIVFPYNKDCDWGGLADSPGSVAWINGFSKQDYGRTSDQELEWDASMIAHELAHNLGVDHANSVSCWTTSSWTALSANCDKPVEYGDPFDLMGGGMEKVTQNFHGTQLMSTWHRAQLGHLPASDQQTITTDGVYPLAAANAAGGTRLMRISRGAVGAGVTRANQEIVLETRDDGPLFDHFSLDSRLFPVGAPLGVLVRTAPTVDRALPSQLVDMKPATKTLLDAPLRAGGTFTDLVTGISVQLASIDADGNAQVAIGGLLRRSPDGVTPVIAAPAPARDGGSVRLPGNRKIKLHFPGAGKIALTAYRYSITTKSSELASVTLPKWLGSSADIEVVASGGTLAKKIKRKLRLRGGQLSLRAR